MKITGTLVPIKNRVLFSEMEFGEEKTKSGIVLKSDDGTTQGIKPRWGRVWAVGPEQKDFKIGEWILIEHGRWSRAAEVENEDGSITKVQMADVDAIMLISKKKPSDIDRRN